MGHHKRGVYRANPSKHDWDLFQENLTWRLWMIEKECVGLQRTWLSKRTGRTFGIDNTLDQNHRRKGFNNVYYKFPLSNIFLQPFCMPFPLRIGSSNDCLAYRYWFVCVDGGATRRWLPAVLLVGTISSGGLTIHLLLQRWPGNGQVMINPRMNADRNTPSPLCTRTAGCRLPAWPYVKPT